MKKQPQLSAEEREKLRKLGLAVIETEAKAILELKERIDASFTSACGHLLACKGRMRGHTGLPKLTGGLHAPDFMPHLLE